VVILDLGLPDIDGIEVVRQLREWTSVPIVVLSVRDDERTKIAALEQGADDYLTKPFSIGELVARIRVALRHAAGQTPTEPVLTFGDLRIDLARRVVTLAGEEVHLTPTEYDLLRVLALNAGRILTHQMLLSEVWGPASADQTHYLRVYVNQLRRKIEPDPSRWRFIVTEPGIGYRFRHDPTDYPGHHSRS
jgi:two-component system KDP operon response regulator KdpE